MELVNSSFGVVRPHEKPVGEADEPLIENGLYTEDGNAGVEGNDGFNGLAWWAGVDWYDGVVGYDGLYTEDGKAGLEGNAGFIGLSSLYDGLPSPPERTPGLDTIPPGYDGLDW